MSSVALSYAINLLARREYSEFELRHKMQDKNFSEEDITAVIDHCQRKNWQNDKRFAENYLYSRARRGYGSNRIRQELHQLKGISTDIINEVLLNTEIDWCEIAESVLQKKFPAYADDQALDIKTKHKIRQYMLSHGFNSEEFSEMIKF